MSLINYDEEVAYFFIFVLNRFDINLLEGFKGDVVSASSSIRLIPQMGAIHGGIGIYIEN